jgi:hypothetical protein
MVRTRDGLTLYQVEITGKQNHPVPLANPDPKIFPVAERLLYHADAMRKLEPPQWATVPRDAHF